MNAHFVRRRSRWQLRLNRENRPTTLAYAAMRSVNPVVIPRNRRVEEALAAAENHNDLSVLHRLLATLATPYEVGTDTPMYILNLLSFNLDIYISQL